LGCVPSSSVAESQWRKTRVDRMLVEHFLRAGYYESAMGLAKQADIEDLVMVCLHSPKDVQ
jgi:macrophage erythroblast attacher